MHMHTVYLSLLNKEKRKINLSPCCLEYAWNMLPLL